MTSIDLWDKIHSILRSATTERIYTTWLEATSLEDVEETAVGKVLKIGVPGPFYRDWISTNFMGELEKIISSEIQDPFKIELIITPRKDEQQILELNYDPIPTVATPTPNAVPRRDILNPEYTFSTFVVGTTNQIAHAACHSITERPGKHVNPLFICGPSGTGKTHLLNAVGNAIREKSPHLRICYVSGEKFLNDVVAGIRHGQMHKFHQRYRDQYDYLIMDDIHIIGRTNNTQEEFFHTFNAFYDAGKQIVVASDKLPREIDGLEDRLRTRLEWGLTVDIQPPDIETRMAILRYKAERSGVFIPDEVVSLIAQISKKSVRELEGNLATIRMYSELRGVPITQDLAKEVFATTLQQQKSGLTQEELIRIVAEHYSLTSRDLKSETRVKTVVKPRQIAMYLSRKLLSCGYAEIGRAFGNRDHTTVLHAEEKINTLLNDDLDFRSEINRLENHINNTQWMTL